MKTFPLLTEGYRKRVLPKVHDFFRYPIDYLDSSWLANRPMAEATLRMQQKQHSRAPLSDWLLQHFKLTTRIDCDFSEPNARMALLNTQELFSLVQRAGALVYSNEIRNLPEDIAVPEDLRRFVVSKAPFLTRKVPDYCIPESIDDWTDADRSMDHLLRAGLNLLGLSLAEVPSSVTDRIALKLPQVYEAHWQSSLTTESSDDRVQEARRLVLKIYREVDPSCSLL